MKIGKKKGQVSLFIILAILLVSAIILLFYYWKPGIFSSNVSQPRLEQCLEDVIQDKIVLLSSSAGVLDSKFNYLYNGRNYTFVCYTDEFFQPCVNQVPLLTKTFEESLSKLLKEEFQLCYDSSVSDLKRRGFDVSEGTIDFDVTMEPGSVLVSIDAPVTVSSGDISSRTQKYNYRYKTNLYEMLMVATSLVQFETYYGASEQTTQMMLYPNIKIDKQRRDGEVTVYTLTEKNEDFDYLFAVKSFPYPAGGYF